MSDFGDPDGDRRVIRLGCLVIVFLAHDDLAHVYVKEGEILNNKWGSFHHNDIIGKSFGAHWKSRARGGGWVYALAPTPELWAMALPHRTQIVHEIDASMIVFMLGVQPGFVVVESGTGSGAMSTTLMRAIAPDGHLHTFEFNEVRSEAARKEFHRNELEKLVTVRHRDVCGREGFAPLSAASVDAVFLDLPEPWLAVPHAARVVRPDGRVGSYSPCIEQAVRCCAAFRAHGFHSVKTIETRLKTYDVRTVSAEVPDFGYGYCLDGGSLAARDASGYTPKWSGKVIAMVEGAGRQDAQGCAGASADAAADCAEVNHRTTSAKKRARSEVQKGALPSSSSSSLSANGSTAVHRDARVARDTPNNEGSKKINGSDLHLESLCAKSITMMRGHTAFLTFATRSIHASAAGITSTAAANAALGTLLT
jgi:tRNA (adenine57-N1/adenine58-N1)-methyltransferase